MRHFVGAVVLAPKTVAGSSVDPAPGGWSLARSRLWTGAVLVVPAMSLPIRGSEHEC